jgi:hypothetical protein
LVAGLQPYGNIGDFLAELSDLHRSQRKADIPDRRPRRHVIPV